MNAIVLFDGVCNFCNYSVNFIIRRDHTRKFKFASLESAAGKEFLKKYGVGDGTDSIVLIDGGEAYTYSTAALRIARELGGAMSLLYGFIIVPRPIRDFFYRLFARNRYRLFGKKEVCMVPTQEVRERFL